MQHEVVDRRVGKAEEELGADGVFQLVVPEKIRQQAIGIVPADGGHDQVDLRVAEELQQIGGPRLGMIPDKGQTLQGVGGEADLQAIGLQSPDAALKLVADKGFPEHAAREADDADRFDCAHVIFSCFTL